MGNLRNALSIPYFQVLLSEQDDEEIEKEAIK